jgi:hypothetical protein
MNLAKLIEYLRARTKLLVRISIVILALIFLGDALFVNKAVTHTPMEKFPGFWSIFGFIGCVAIILVSKWFGHAGIMKREDYYDE